MIKEALEYLFSLKEPEFVKVEDRPYAVKNLTPIHKPMPKTIEVHTLSALVDYTIKDVDGIRDPLLLDDVVLHILSSLQVFLYSTITPPFKQRPCYLHATTPGCHFRFGTFMEVEPFIIGVQSQFIQDENTALIYKSAGNIKDSIVKTVQDDGVAQQITVATGAARVAEVQLPSPIELRPYRTFPEVTQPSSKFIFRMRSGQGGGPPTCALFEADGGIWEMEAIQTIKEWFEHELDGENIVILA